MITTNIGIAMYRNRDQYHLSVCRAQRFEQYSRRFYKLMCREIALAMIGVFFKLPRPRTLMSGDSKYLHEVFTLEFVYLFETLVMYTYATCENARHITPNRCERTDKNVKLESEKNKYEN